MADNDKPRIIPVEQVLLAALEKIAQLVSKYQSEPLSCLVCKQQDWTINGPFRMVIDQRIQVLNPGLVVGGHHPYIPTVNLMCRLCGFCLSFNLIQIGVMSIPDDKPLMEQGEAVDIIEEMLGIKGVKRQVTDEMAEKEGPQEPPS